MEVGEVLLLQPWVQLHLVYRGNDITLLQHTLDLCLAEVGDANGLCLALLEHLLQCLVRVDVVGLLYLGLVVAVLGEGLVATGKGHRPVDQEEVDIIGLQVLQRGVECFLDIVGVVCVVPELGGHEEVLTWDARLLDALGYCGLGTVAMRTKVSWAVRISSGNLCNKYVHACSVNVLVASLDSVVDGILLSVSVLPCAEADGRDGGASVKLELGRHIELLLSWWSYLVWCFGS